MDDSFEAVGFSAFLSNPVLLAAFAVIIAQVLLYQLINSSSLAPLPPGPPRHWLWGTKIESPFSWRHFERLSKDYGPVFTVYIGRKPLVVVNTYADAQKLLEQKAMQTSDRPRQHVASNVLSHNSRILLIGAGDRWRRMRRALHSRLNAQMAQTYEEMQAKLATRLVADIVADPETHQGHVETFATSLVLQMTYGITRRLTKDDPIVRQISQNQMNLGKTLRPGFYLAEAFPLLSCLPGSMSEVRRWSKTELDLFVGQLSDVRTNLKAGTLPPCFAAFLLENQRDLQLSDLEISYLCGSMFGAGSGTTASTVQTSVMAAACFPDVQAKVQEELDRVVGRERLPTFADWPDLPYTWAFCREVLRWRPVSAGGFQHKTTEDVGWRGYIIPKGTAIVGCHWSIMRDPSVFEDPDDFRPERFLRPTADWGWRPTTAKELSHQFAFGFGRRVCAGQHVAERSLYICVAILHHIFTMGHKKDVEGRDIPIDTLAFSDTANSHPLPGMPISFAPRFQGAENLLLS